MREKPGADPRASASALKRNGSRPVRGGVNKTGLTGLATSAAAAPMTRCGRFRAGSLSPPIPHQRVRPRSLGSIRPTLVEAEPDASPRTESTTSPVTSSSG